ncbi:MAG TPA: hypothetical protein VNT60_08080, partial [Deinococcales bacterium]|nr:hypothetical protein [Deinococcales bacterium]
MSRLASLVTALLASLALAGALAQAAFTGSYTAQGQNGTITLSLQQSGNNVSGTLAAGNASFRMAGQVQPDGTVLGLADSGQGQVYFLAQVQGNNLELILAEIDPRTNGVVPGSERSIVFARSGGAPPAAGASGGLPGVGQAPAAQAAPFAGTFQNPDMTLALQASGNAYGGTLTAGSSRYEVQAQGSGSSLNGSLVAGGTTYLFVATLSGNTLSLQVNGVTYQLTRAAPAAPAQGGALPGLPGGVTLPGNTSAGVGAAAPTAAAAPATGFPANALEAQANQVYSTGTYVKSTQHGVAVRVPAGFQGGAFNGGLLLGKGNELNLLMIPVVGAAVGELTATLSQPLHLAEGLEFQPAARPTVRGNAVTVPMRSGQLTATAYGLAGPDVGV